MTGLRERRRQCFIQAAGQDCSLLAGLISRAAPCQPSGLSSPAQHSKDFRQNEVSGTSRKGSLGQPICRAAHILASGRWEQAHVCLPAGQGVLVNALAFSFYEPWIIIVLQWQVTRGPKSSLETCLRCKTRRSFWSCVELMDCGSLMGKGSWNNICL